MLLNSSGVIRPEGIPFGHAYRIQPEIIRHGIPEGNILRCWQCGSIIGEKQSGTFLVSSNKVEIGGIPLSLSVWRRCRGGKSHPNCRAVNKLPTEWVVTDKLLQ